MGGCKGEMAGGSIAAAIEEDVNFSQARRHRVGRQAGKKAFQMNTQQIVEMKRERILILIDDLCSCDRAMTIKKMADEEQEDNNEPAKCKITRKSRMLGHVAPHVPSVSS